MPTPPDKSPCLGILKRKFAEDTISSPLSPVNINKSPSPPNKVNSKPINYIVICPMA